MKSSEASQIFSFDTIKLVMIHARKGVKSNRFRYGSVANSYKLCYDKEL